MPTLNLVGCGRVGKTLAHLWHTRQVLQIQDVLTTSVASAAQAVAFIGAGHAVPTLAQMRPADLWLLAVPDRQIASSADEMANVFAAQAPAIVFHCSGAAGASALAPLRERGWQVASAHCILSFASPASAVQQFAGTPCGIEGEAAAIARLHAAQSRGSRCRKCRRRNGSERRQISRRGL